MSIPAPSEGESHLDEQSETTSAPVPEQDPPVLTRRTPVLMWGLWGLWAALGLALVIAAVVIAL
ncbi:MAG TPA: hypothetical protein VFK41_04775 [Nocardioidaceae bacterium]|nr:hypothetical protein [Nocardioidaceae bacterium]